MFSTGNPTNQDEYSQGYTPRGSQGINTPPLHHPVPQHPINNLRSPIFTEPAPSQFDASGAEFGVGTAGHVRTSAYQPQAQAPQVQVPMPNQPQLGGQPSNIPYGNFFSDTRSAVGLQVGRNAVLAGQEYVQANFKQYVSVTELRYYFQVSTTYVWKKILLVLFPYRHAHWTRGLRRSDTVGAPDVFEIPADDINAPDLYIPTMAWTTYVILQTIKDGLKGDFKPDLFGYYASVTTSLIVAEMIIFKFGAYIFNVDYKFYDVLAHSGYKFIGIIIASLASSLISGRVLVYLIFLFTATSLAFFMLRSLRSVALPASTSTQTITQRQRAQRIKSLFVYCYLIQIAFMFILF